MAVQPPPAQHREDQRAGDGFLQAQTTLHTGELPGNRHWEGDILQVPDELIKKASYILGCSFLYPSWPNAGGGREQDDGQAVITAGAGVPPPAGHYLSTGQLRSFLPAVVWLYNQHCSQ